MLARTDRGISTPADLKGKTIAVNLGHVPHLSLSRLLREHGMTERDVRLVNMNSSDSTVALATGQVDAIQGAGAGAFSLVDQGIAKIIFASRDRKSKASNFGAFLVTEEFAFRYPEATKRVLKAYLQAVHWVSLPENREAAFKFWALNSATNLEFLRRENAGQDLKDKADPLLDEYYIERYRDGIRFALEAKLVRVPVEIDTWFDKTTFNAALNELGYEGFWAPRNAAGDPLLQPAAAN